MSFSFGKKSWFSWLLSKRLESRCQCIPRTTLTHVVYNLFKKGKIVLQKLFRAFDGRVSIYSDIWSNKYTPLRVSLIIGLIINWIMQKRIIAFRGFDERHTTDNIYKMIKTILEWFFFLIGFDNAFENTTCIPELEEVLTTNFWWCFSYIRCSCRVLHLCVQYMMSWKFSFSN